MFTLSPLHSHAPSFPLCLLIRVIIRASLQIISRAESEKTLSQDVINCPRCQRRTPAARGACLYCGEALPLTMIEAAPPQRNIDTFEPAFNTILDPTQPRLVDSAASALAAALRVETSDALAYIRSGKPLPIARSQNRQEAEMIALLVRSCGLSASVIADRDLALESELSRARRTGISEQEIEVDYSGGVMRVSRSEIKLMVLGRLGTSRVDYTEGLSGARGQTTSVIDTAEYRSDEMLLDVYGSSLDRSFRIKADAFDYSGLVAPLSFRAEVNFKAALGRLCKLCPQAKLDDDFTRVRGLLGRAWPERTRSEARGIKRAGISYRPVAKASVVSDNRDQFDRYSRLMFLSLAGAGKD